MYMLAITPRKDPAGADEQGARLKSRIIRAPIRMAVDD